MQSLPVASRTDDQDIHSIHLMCQRVKGLEVLLNIGLVLTSLEPVGVECHRMILLEKLTITSSACFAVSVLRSSGHP